MNILHHKSWHVGRRDNIERVMRDEKLAKEEADKKAAKILAADQEARLNLLRSKSQLPSIQPVDTGGHVNLFQKEEDLAKRAITHAPNDEYEAERLAKEAKDKKKDVSYLGEGSVEFSRQTPWYQKKEKKAEFSENQEKILKANDPMADMEVYLNQMKGIFPKTEREKQLDAREARRQRGRERFEDKKRKLEEIATSKEEAVTKKPKPSVDPSDHPSSSSSSDSSDSDSDSSSDSEGSEKEARKHHKKGHKKDRKQREKEKEKERKKKKREMKGAKRKQEEVEEEQRQQQQREKLAKMRDERAQREREERERVSKINKDLGTPMDIYRHRYYSQFNPNHAKPSFTPNRK